jgi:hypothetical protein
MVRPIRDGSKRQHATRRRLVNMPRPSSAVAVDFGELFPPSDERAQQRQEEGFAEAPVRRLRLQVERLADQIGVELIKDNPKPYIGIQTGAALFDGGNFSREARRLRPLGADRENENEIAIRPGKVDADGNRPLLTPLPSLLPAPVWPICRGSE